MAFDHSIGLHFSQGLVLPNLVAIGHYWAIWPLVDLDWPLYDLLPPHSTSLWSGVLPSKFGSHRTFLSNMTPGLPLHDLWPQLCTSLWSGVLPTNFGSHRAFLNNLTPVWPRLTLHDLWPQQCTTLQSGDLPTKCGNHRVFIKQLDIWMTIELWWGRFEIMLSNLVGPSPTPVPSFSSIPQSTTKRIAVYTYILTDLDILVV